MTKLQEFMNMLIGEFHNLEQYETKQEEQISFPYAKHVNTICNDKIKNLPDDFQGIFLLEESYYTTNGNTHASPHLFLFTEEEDAIKLTSYPLPKNEEITYETMPEMDYTTLQPSPTFTPIVYHEQNGVWEGESVSMFSPVVKFTLKERFSKAILEVEETMEVNGKRTFGFDEPILYTHM